MAQTDTIADSSVPLSNSDMGVSTPRTLVPQFALDAADAKIASWSTAIVDAADTIERLVASESLPLPDSVRDLATATTKKLRSFGTESGEYEAAEMVSALQRTAAAHSAASIGVGAAIGATLAALLVRFGTSSTATAGATSSAQSPAPNGATKEDVTGKGVANASASD